MANDAVISALEDQVSCYRRLAKLAEIQHEHVQNSQTDLLLEVLQQRQEVLNRIAQLEQTISLAKHGWNDYLTGLVVDQRSIAEGLLAERRQLLEQITTADRNDAMVLQQRKISLGRQINQASAARTMNRNYAASAYGSSRASQMDIQQ